MEFTLSGDNAFYKQPDYEKNTIKNFSNMECVSPDEPAFIYESTSRVWRIVKEIFSVLLILPLIYNIIHALIGKIVVLGSFRYPAEMYNNMAFNGDIKYKRFTIQVDGQNVDTVISSDINGNFDSKRWLLVSSGNSTVSLDSYRNLGSNPGIGVRLSDKLNCNVIYYNYPGAAGSTGWPSRSAMKNTYQAMLKFLEEKMGAEEIIGYGFSLGGGGAQGDALNDYQFKHDVKYVFVKDRTFNNLATIAGVLGTFLAKWAVYIFGWNSDAVESSKKLSCPEIITQQGSSNVCTDITSLNDLEDTDGLITKESSLANALFGQPTVGVKHFVGIPENHTGGGHIMGNNTLEYLCNKIETCLA